LSGSYDWLVRLVTWLDDSVGGAHADWKEARVDHDRVQMPSAIIIGKAIQSESDRIFRAIGGSIRIGVPAIVSVVVFVRRPDTQETSCRRVLLG
jgi:hypothetical protein